METGWTRDSVDGFGLVFKLAGSRMDGSGTTVPRRYEKSTYIFRR